METKGFVPSLSDAVTLDQFFPYVAYYILVSGVAGDIVWQNDQGQLNYISNAPIGYNIVGATKILSSGTVNGTPRTTTASGLTYFCGTFP